MGTKDLEIARRFRQLIERNVTPCAVLMFGSRARGTASEDSDLDVLVSVERSTREIEKFISDCAWEAGFPENVVVVPVVVEQQRLERGHLSESAFIRNVLREGVRV